MHLEIIRGKFLNVYSIFNRKLLQKHNQMCNYTFEIVLCEFMPP
jgi:hypothetical protein